MPNSPIKELELEYSVGPAKGVRVIHGSSSISTAGVDRNFTVVKEDEEVTVSGDHNQPLTTEETRRDYCLNTGNKKRAVNPDPESIREAILNSVVTVKMRVGGAQYAKDGEIVAKTVEASMTFVDQKKLPKGTVCGKLVFKKDPMEMTRLERLAISNGLPLFARFENVTWYITPDGNLNNVTSYDAQQAQVQLSVDHPTELLKDKDLANGYKKKLTYILFEKKIYFINGYNDNLEVQGPLALNQIKAEPLEKYLKKLFIQTAVAPVNKEDMKMLSALLPAQYMGPNEGVLSNVFAGVSTEITPATAEDLQAIERATAPAEMDGFVPHENLIPLARTLAWERDEQSINDFKKKAEIIKARPECKDPNVLIKLIGELIRKEFNHFRYLYDVIDGNDHPETVTISEDNIHIAFNSPHHHDLNPNFFRFNVSVDPRLENHVLNSMYIAYRGLVLKEAIEHFKARGPNDKGKDFVAPANLDAMLTETTLIKPEFTREELVAWKVPADCIEALLEPVIVPTHYPALLKLYQSCIKDSNKSGKLTENHFRTLFETAYKSDEFLRINTLKTNSFFGYDPEAAMEAINALNRNYPELATLTVHNIKAKMSAETGKAIAKILKGFDKIIKPATQKAYNATLGLVDALGIADASQDNVFDYNDGGFVPPKKPDGTTYTAAELTRIQIKYMEAHIYHLHTMFPGSTITTSLIEAGDQDVKKTRITLITATINARYDALHRENNSIINEMDFNNAIDMYDLKMKQMERDPEIQKYVQQIEQIHAQRIEFRFPQAVSFNMRTDIGDLSKHALEVKQGENMHVEFKVEGASVSEPQVTIHTAEARKSSPARDGLFSGSDSVAKRVAAFEAVEANSLALT